MKHLFKYKTIYKLMWESFSSTLCRNDMHRTLIPVFWD